MSERSTDWWKSAVVYQIYPRSFSDANGDGIGDVRGIIERLDYLQQLGVDVLWLSPIYKSPQDDNGYDISDYQDIDPLFGSLADVDELIAGMHARGMKLVMDLVVNHTSDEHPWFVESRSSKDNPKRDWYWWRPAREGMEPGTPGAEPNDWHSYFSGSTWELDPITQEYYLHLFSKKQPDLNWENPEVRKAVYAMMNWWLERGVDGFRMDVINLISKNPALPDGNSFTDVCNGPRMHEFLQEMHREVLAGKHLITVGEMPGVSVRDAQLYTGADRDELNMVFQFEHMGLDVGDGSSGGLGKWVLAPLSLPRLKENLSKWQKGLEQQGWNSLYWNNHDQPRIVSRWGNDGAYRVLSAKALGTLLHCMHGTPYVYQGEEIGMTNGGFASVHEHQDIEARNYAKEAAELGIPEEEVVRSLAVKGRDNARTPMQWDASANAGFTTGTPWMRVTSNYTEINAADAVADPESVFHHYRKLIAFRHASDIVVHGDFDLLLPDHEQVFAYTRTLGGKRLLVLANCSDGHVTLGVDETLRQFADSDAVIAAGVITWSDSALDLAPWASAVYEG